MSKPIVLVPSDLSAASKPAIDVAFDLSARLGARLVLLHVWQPDPATDSGSVTLAHRIREHQTELHLAALVKLHPGPAPEGVELENRVVAGDPVDAIIETIDELRPLLVVMGTHGRSGVRRVLLGSVAETLIRRVTVPVVIVRNASASDLEE